MADLSKTVADIPSARQKKKGPGRWKPVLLAVAVPLGLIAVLWFVFREQLVHAVPVETGRVILLEQEGTVSSGAQAGAAEMMFQASGWVEPSPWQIDLAFKVSGFVEQVFVKEGEVVTNGQIVATLDPADAQFELAAAESRVQAAQKKLVAATARLTGRRDTWERYSKTDPNAIALNEREKAKQVFLEAEAEEQVARATLNVAIVERDAARLALDRTTVRAPMSGIVLRRYANPGDKRMTGADDAHSSDIVSIYDPEQLQVRVDVPIAEAGKMTVGQPCRITTAMLPGQIFEGRVTGIIGEADLQRNTLQAKVKIDDPDVRLRPDVLCRVEFWKAASAIDAGTASSGSHALWIPVGALQSDALEQEIWVVDPLTHTAHKRSVELTSSVRAGFRQVAEGVRANEVIVLTGKGALEEGARVKEVTQ